MRRSLTDLGPNAAASAPMRDPSLRIEPGEHSMPWEVHPCRRFYSSCDLHIESLQHAPHLQGPRHQAAIEECPDFSSCMSSSTSPLADRFVGC